MKKVIQLIIWVVCILGMGGCNTNYGFPSKVSFTAEGEETRIYGNDDIFTLEFEEKSGIFDADNCSELEDPVRLCFEYKWLTVVLPLGGGYITLIAEPNESNKKRKIILNCYCTRGSVDITVEQAPKRD